MVYLQLSVIRQMQLARLCVLHNHSHVVGQEEVVEEEVEVDDVVMEYSDRVLVKSVMSSVHHGVYHAR